MEKGKMEKERSKWFDVTDRMNQEDDVEFGRHLTYRMEKTPPQMAFFLSHYKFAAKLIGRGKKVLDIGCGEGLGTWLLAVECGFAKGVDFDEDSVGIAQKNWRDQRVEFKTADFMLEAPGTWDAVVNFDVIEHIRPEGAKGFLRRIGDNLAHDGICIIGTPSLESRKYAPDVSRAGQINVYAQERLEAEMKEHFHHVFMFTGNDEVIQTMSPRAADYLIAVGCRKRN